MAFPLLHPVIVGIVVGMRAADEVRADVESFEADVPAGLRDDRRDEGLLAPRTVGPGRT